MHHIYTVAFPPGVRVPPRVPFYMPKKNKEKFNYESIRNAEQFLTDLNNATIEKLNFQVENEKYYETPDWLRNRYNQAMQDLGRWIVRDLSLIHI